MSTLKDKIKAQQYKKVTLNEIEFTIKKMDYLEFQRLASKVRSGATDFEIEIILSAIKDVKGIKTKDVVESTDGFTAEELEELLEFDREYIQIYLGKNQEVLVELYNVVVQDFMKFTEEKNKKKVNSPTELSE